MQTNIERILDEAFEQKSPIRKRELNQKGASIDAPFCNGSLWYSSFDATFLPHYL